MSKSEENGPGARLQDWKDDFDALTYRATGSVEGLVLNTDHEPPHLYTIDLDEPSCTCDYVPEHGHAERTCKHLAKAMLAHPDFHDSHELAVRDLSVLVDRASSAVREAENVADVLRADGQAETSQRAAQAVSEGEDHDPELSSGEAVDVVDEWAQEELVVYPALDISSESHDGRPGVAIRPDYDGISEGQKEGMKATINNLETSEVHVGFTDDGCQTCGAADDDFFYFLPQAGLREALA